MSKTVIPIDEIPVLPAGQFLWPTPERFSQGMIIPFDKPLHFTSFDVVKYIRRKLPVKKVGHAGTLDPLATGLLLVCCGRATRSVSQIHDLKKTYRATVSFGASTPSQDAGTKPDATAEWKHLTKSGLESIISEQFSGSLFQVPPMFSALQRNGERLYKIARRGETVKRPPRPITIYRIEILKWSLPDVVLEITCGKGTYVRTIAHDLGRAAGSRAYLSSLRRIRIGNYDVGQAWSPTEFRKWREVYG